MLLPMKYGDLKVDRDPFDLKPDIVSRLQQKHVGDETLLRLRVAHGSMRQQAAAATSQSSPPRLPVTPTITAYSYGDPLSKALSAAGPPPAGVFRIGGDVSQPVRFYAPEPEYSEEALRAKFTGAVLLSVVIDKDGNTRDIKVVRPLGLGLDQKAIDAVSKWRFRPAMKQGQAVAVQAYIEVNFRLVNDSRRDSAAPKN